jgi:two-component system, chemotaxis family, CheB/CheR fusion protein
LSTAVHELATNAGKYGSLSVRSGQVELSWAVERTKQGLALLLDWKERNGPPPKRTPRPGFGSKLIHTVIERQLGGSVQQSFEPQGLTARLTIPLTHERWPDLTSSERTKASAPTMRGPGDSAGPFG